MNLRPLQLDKDQVADQLPGSDDEEATFMGHNRAASAANNSTNS